MFLLLPAKRRIFVVLSCGRQNGTLRQPVRNLLFPLAVLLSVAAFSTPARAADCHALAQSALPDTTILTAKLVSGSFTPPYGASLTGLPAFCRVSGILHPTADSVIRFEVWMPEKGWNHRFLGTGNGGFAGSIYY